MRYIVRITLAFALTHTLAHADTIYKCGEAYTNLPCKNGKVLFDNPTNSREEDRVTRIHQYYQDQLRMTNQYYRDRELTLFGSALRSSRINNSVNVDNENNNSASSGASSYDGGRSSHDEHRRPKQ